MPKAVKKPAAREHSETVEQTSSSSPNKKAKRQTTDTNPPRRSYNQWKADEDARLIDATDQLVRSAGWSTLAKAVGTRDDHACRARYTSLLKKWRKVTGPGEEM
ncbi:hypothetical protein HDV00_007706 [Rhizophlyctis rosea]|nr:hypothetical protein HDV00_007706 [Rhizophlyctis rosea]